MTPVATDRRPRVLAKRMVKTRDAAELCTDVYLPETEEPRPTILVRTPYGRQVPFLLLLVRRLNAAGFAVALQDSRGRYQSTGAFDWRREHTDAYDTLSWLADQEWADGSVGLVGISISGCSNFLLAATPPPSGIRVRALVSIVAIVDYYSLFYRDGALVQHWAQPVSLMMGASRLAPQAAGWDEIFRHLPLGEVPGRSERDAWLWRSVLAHPRPDEFWDEVDAHRVLDEVRVPVLHLSGWYDFILHQTLRAHAGLAPSRAGGGAPQQLVVGPWDHQTIFASFSGRPAPGGTPADPQASLNLMEHAIDWFRRYCGEADSSAFAPEPPVRLYVMGEGAWIGADRFPLPEAEPRDLYLASAGRANTADGDGRLVEERPAERGQDAFSYDPADPVPTTGGATWLFPPGKLSAGPLDQAAVERRADVLVYSGAPLPEDLIVAGPVEVELWAASSALDTDFTGKLVDVDPQGVARIVQDGIVRARHLAPHGGPPADLSRPRCYRIDLQATAHTFRAGHRVRLEISSSNFPKYNRNLNRGEPIETAAVGVPAAQVVFHGGDRASHLRLPVLSRTAFEACRRRGERGGEGRP